MPPAKVIEQLRAGDGFGEYAQMLTAEGLASDAVIDGVISHKRGMRLTEGRPVTTEWLRHEVKEYFRDRVVAKLTDPGLDPQASYQQMRRMLDGLSTTDRGNLAEHWYRARYAPDAAPHVNVGVTRTGGENAGKVESRFIDAVQGDTAIEVKDIQGKIDEEQLGAYLDMLKARQKTGEGTIKKLKYVFTKPEGAVANVEVIAKSMEQSDFAGRISIEAFDRNGKRHIATTAADARRLSALPRNP
jgi:hypothetical protein